MQLYTVADLVVPKCLKVKYLKRDVDLAFQQNSKPRCNHEMMSKIQWFLLTFQNEDNLSLTSDQNSSHELSFAYCFNYLP